MKAIAVLILSALFVGASARGQTNAAAPFAAPPSDNPPYVPPPAKPKPHVVDVPQPGDPGTTDTNAPPAPTPPASSDANLDPAKVAEYQKRFQQGVALEKAGKLNEARQIYDGILAEQPNAKGSLLHAGEISFELGEMAKADGYLEKLHAIVPDFTDAIELLIQINQSLKRDVKVELLLRDYRALYDNGKITKPYFIRETIHSEQQDIVIAQFFDYTKGSNTVWMADVLDADDHLKRRILLNYDPDTTKALRAKDPKYAGTQVFVWCEPQFQNGQISQIDAYLQIFALPDYQKFRSAMLLILSNPPKPMYSVPVSASTPPAH
jgi:tetratricopeptide (TPR) repeat protein